MSDPSVWPWYIAGPLIGIVVPIVYLYAGRKWGVSSTLRDICAATIPGRIDYFQYAWRSKGGWRLAMAAGLVAGGLLMAVFAPSEQVAISAATQADLAGLGITDLQGLAPAQVFSWDALLSVPGLIMVVGGGFLVGFGTRYANGCTSGHAISGLANLRLQSLIAVIGFFIGGLLSTHVLLPLIMGGPS